MYFSEKIEITYVFKIYTLRFQKTTHNEPGSLSEKVFDFHDTVLIIIKQFSSQCSHLSTEASNSIMSLTVHSRETFCGSSEEKLKRTNSPQPPYLPL